LKALAFVGWSGSGKTTLLLRLIPLLKARGHTVGYLKSDAHGFDMDREGKDTWRAFESGAERVGIVSRSEGALRFRPANQSIREILDEQFRGCDLVLLEGFKGSDLPKVEVVSGARVVADDDPGLLAVVSDLPDPRPVPRFGREDISALALFVEATPVGTMGPTR
jgi:molybdopterin-guanine dinucleotide biosynthesis protein MobB